jgi:hypothetical protein
MLAAIVVAALAGGFLTMMRATEASSDRQRGESALTSFTESLKTLQYTSCTSAIGHQQQAADYLSAYQAWAGRWSPPASASVSDLEITDVEYWHPSGSGNSAGAYDTTCPSPDSGAQRLTVSVTVNGKALKGQVVLRSTT